MARNGSENSVSIRDERGRYLKGIAGGPGRPAGSRNKLTEEFLGDQHAAWHEHGREAIDRVVAERPEVFLAIVAKTIDVRRIEIGQPEEFSRRYTKEAIIEKLEEKAGPRARTGCAGNPRCSPRWRPGKAQGIELTMPPADT